MYPYTAYLAFAVYPFIVVILFNRLGPVKGLIWTILLGYLFLPQTFKIDLPMVPSIDKHVIPAVVAAVILAQRGRQELRRTAQKIAATLDDTTAQLRTNPARITHRKRHWLLVLLVIVMVLSPIGVSYSNSDFYILGNVYVPGMTLYDAIGIAMSTALMLVPFLLARRYLHTAEAQKILLMALVLAALIYAPFVLLEMRISPQLHWRVYGIMQHSFIQHVRNGYRPMVFLSHGLEVGTFLCMSCVAAAAMWRISRQEAKAAPPAPRHAAQPDAAAPAPVLSATPSTSEAPAVEGQRGRRITPKTITPQGWALRLGGLVVLLFFSRNLGALGIALFILPLVLLLGRRGMLTMAAVIGLCVLTYPMLRGAGFVPTETVVSTAAAISQDRADSLAYRLRNEDMLLDRANERPLLGWGSWGRNRVRDTTTGEELSTTDGMWVIVIGSMGWVGYLCRFGLLVVPILLVWRRAGSMDLAAAGLAMVMAANLIDLIPNAGLTPVGWMVAGSLAGRAEMAMRDRRAARRSERSAERERSGAAPVSA